MFEIPFELEALSQAENYQKWIFLTVAPYLGKRVIEIGAGIGNMSQHINARDRLILTEYHPELTVQLKKNVQGWSEQNRHGVEVLNLNIQKDDLSSLISENLDTVVSFNVLEHIEKDKDALSRFCELIKNSKGVAPKRIVTFVPAHQWAYGSIDRGFGHFRRYAKRDLTEICRQVDPTARLTTRYFNTAGLLGWVWNGRILKKETIGRSSVIAFEKLCPLIAPVDNFLHRVLKFPFGQSLLAIMELD